MISSRMYANHLVFETIFELKGSIQEEWYNSNLWCLIITEPNETTMFTTREKIYDRFTGVGEI